MSPQPNVERILCYFLYVILVEKHQTLTHLDIILCYSTINHFVDQQMLHTRASYIHIYIRRTVIFLDFVVRGNNNEDIYFKTVTLWRAHKRDLFILTETYHKSWGKNLANTEVSSERSWFIAVHKVSGVLCTFKLI